MHFVVITLQILSKCYICGLVADIIYSIHEYEVSMGDNIYSLYILVSEMIVIYYVTVVGGRIR